jgi:hypothetical protein
MSSLLMGARGLVKGNTRGVGEGAFTFILMLEGVVVGGVKGNEGKETSEGLGRLV